MKLIPRWPKAVTLLSLILCFIWGISLLAYELVHYGVIRVKLDELQVKQLWVYCVVVLVAFEMIRCTDNFRGAFTINDTKLTRMAAATFFILAEFTFLACLIVSVVCGKWESDLLFNWILVISLIAAIIFIWLPTAKGSNTS